ncbi:MAG: GNAT family N-acetyltransferase [Thermoanaerobaculia bacterium]|nr:GNAT family N-acetyltransferase [Thermoanaerobaculia bacterium]
MEQTTNTLLLTRILPGEATTLRDFAEATFRVAWQHDNEPEPFEAYCREAFSLEKIKTELAAPDSEFYFARLGGEIVAYLELNPGRQPHHDWDAGAAFQLERIYVSHTLQSRGLGAELLRFVENRARETGAEWVWLSVWQRSPRSVAFYQKNGYDIFGVETFWVGNDPQPDWLMRKKV